MAHSAVRLYGAVFAALLVLTVATVTVSYVDLGPASVVVALAMSARTMRSTGRPASLLSRTFSSSPAVLLAFFFLLLRECSGLIWVVSFCCLCCSALLIVLFSLHVALPISLACFFFNAPATT